MTLIYNTQLEGRIFDSTNDAIASMGFDIVRIRVNSGKHSRTVQIMVDRLDGKSVGIEDCEKISKHLSILLDVEEIIEGPYHLEISSAGLDKPLTRLKDFSSAVSNYIRVSVKVPLDSQKRFFGKVLAFKDSILELQLLGAENTVCIAFDNIAEAYLDYFYKEAEPEKRKSKRIN